MSKWVAVTHNERSVYHNDPECSHTPAAIREVSESWVQKYDLEECDVCQEVIIALPRNKSEVFHSKRDTCRNADIITSRRVIPKTKARRLGKRPCSYCSGEHKQRRKQDMSYQDLLKDNNTIDELKRAND
jgi:hypothetical protein